MSGFNHDAAMQRGAERQEAVETALAVAHAFADRQQTVGRDEALIRLSGAVLMRLLERQNKRPINHALDVVLTREAEALTQALEEESKSKPESDAMALVLAKQLLESGTSKIVSDMGMWESGAFREGGS